MQTPSTLPARLDHVRAHIAHLRSRRDTSSTSAENATLTILGRIEGAIVAALRYAELAAAPGDDVTTRRRADNLAWALGEIEPWEQMLREHTRQVAVAAFSRHVEAAEHMKRIYACDSGNWSYTHTGSKDFGQESIVSDLTRQHERRAPQVDVMCRNSDGAVLWRMSVLNSINLNEVSPGTVF